MTGAAKRIVILISGRGSNMRAILEAGLDAKIAAVISNNPGAKGLETARDRGIDAMVVNHREFADRTAFDEVLAAKVASYRPDLVVLAGFMRILTGTFIGRFEHRIMNIHPSLLPAFTGTDTHRRALEEGVRLHGCTVHFVAPDLDRGPIIVQAAVPVLPDDDEDRLAARVLQQEHRIYPMAIRWFLDGQLSIRDGKVSVSAECRYPQAAIAPVPA